jgi:hypothetical protein
MEFVITLVLTLNPSPELNVFPTLVIPLNTSFACGTSWIPHVTTFNPHPGCNREETVRHELIHARQWTALGPAFPLAYTMTGGRAFEDYMDMMWIPPEGMERNCPLFSIRKDSLSVLPCYQF